MLQEIAGQGHYEQDCGGLQRYTNAGKERQFIVADGIAIFRR
jgi:hypothetical protein